MAVGRVDSSELLRLRLLALDAVGNVVVVTDRDGLIVWVNRAFIDLTGFSEDEAVGRTLTILKSGEQEPRVYRDLWATIRAGQVWRGRLVNRRKAGRVYTEDETITPVTGPDGAITHFIAGKQDVTEYQEVRVRLEARGDPDGTVRYESPAVPRILGYEPHELEGHRAFEFMPEEDTGRAVSLLAGLHGAPCPRA